MIWKMPNYLTPHTGTGILGGKILSSGYGYRIALSNGYISVAMWGLGVLFRPHRDESTECSQINFAFFSSSVIIKVNLAPIYSTYLTYWYLGRPRKQIGAWQAEKTNRCIAVLLHFLSFHLDSYIRSLLVCSCSSRSRDTCLIERIHQCLPKKKQILLLRQ